MKAYIDLGSHVGKAINKFMESEEYDDSWVLHAFDANPILVRSYPEQVQEHRQAVWIYDGTVDFYINQKSRTSSYTRGGTILKEKVTGHLDKRHPEKVPCIDISKWLLENFTKEDYVFVKMDVEGAEYAVLEKMLTDGSMDLIDKLHLEWHWGVIGMKEEDHLNLCNRLKERLGDKLHDDYIPISASNKKKRDKIWGK